jgi:hypothetical protein
MVGKLGASIHFPKRHASAGHQCGGYRPVNHGTWAGRILRVPSMNDGLIKWLDGFYRQGSQGLKMRSTEPIIGWFESLVGLWWRLEYRGGLLS